MPNILSVCSKYVATIHEEDSGVVGLSWLHSESVVVTASSEERFPVLETTVSKSLA